MDTGHKQERGIWEGERDFKKGMGKVIEKE